jgi:hypothetical protein
VPSAGRPWSRPGKSDLRSNRHPDAPTRNWFARRSCTACTRAADSDVTDRADRSRRGSLAAADFRHGMASVRFPTAAVVRHGRRPASSQQRRAGRHRTRQPWSAAGRDAITARRRFSRGDFGPCDPWRAGQHRRCMPVRTRWGSADNRRGSVRVRTGGAHVPARRPGCPRPMAVPVGAKPLTVSMSPI